jgi:hypothetical protein
MAKVTLLGFTRHTVAIHTQTGEQRIPVAEGQAVACFLVDNHTEDEAHQVLRRMESVANITPEQIRHLEDYTAPLREQLPHQAEQPQVAPVATENAAAVAEPAHESAAVEAGSDSEIAQTWGDH